MVNALTDPAGAIAADLFAPNTIDADATTHDDAEVQTYANGAKDSDGNGAANNVQPGLKPGNDWKPRPDSVPDEGGA